LKKNFWTHKKWGFALVAILEQVELKTKGEHIPVVVIDGVEKEIKSMF
jgi:hypothetical protein